MTEWVHRACPLCGSNDARPHWEKGSLRIVRCSPCGMAYANPVEAELASGRFYDRIGTSFYLSPDKLESDYAPVRFQRELRLFRSFCARGRVLDVGCSTGAFLFHLKGAGDYRVLGTDVAGEALDYAASRGVDVLRAPFLEHDFGDRRFDAVTFWAVLEHLVDVRAFLARAARLLAPGGHCFVLVPNLHSLAHRLCGPRYRYVMPDHVNYFSPETLQALARREPEFEVRCLRSTHFNPIVIAQDLRGRDARVPDAERARLLQRTTRLKQNPWLKPAHVLYRGAERFLGAFLLADNLVLVLRRR